MDRLASWWQSLPLPWRRWKVVDEVASGGDVPAKLPRRGAAIVIASGEPTWLAFDCPCRRGHRVMLNLSASRNPWWKVQDYDPLTVWPSIDDETLERRCHF